MKCLHSSIVADTIVILVKILVGSQPSPKEDALGLQCEPEPLYSEQMFSLPRSPCFWFEGLLKPVFKIETTVSDMGYLFMIQNCAFKKNFFFN